MYIHINRKREREMLTFNSTLYVNKFKSQLEIQTCSLYRYQLIQECYGLSGIQSIQFIIGKRQFDIYA